MTEKRPDSPKDLTTLVVAPDRERQGHQGNKASGLNPHRIQAVSMLDGPNSVDRIYPEA
tara:strand:+ start:24298 stop:24474 length:177 start_codon:yes stop_codon:yes gene_type:complete